MSYLNFQSENQSEFQNSTSSPEVRKFCKEKGGNGWNTIYLSKRDVQNDNFYIPPTPNDISPQGMENLSNSGDVLFGKNQRQSIDKGMYVGQNQGKNSVSVGFQPYSVNDYEFRGAYFPKCQNAQTLPPIKSDLQNEKSDFEIRKTNPEAQKSFIDPSNYQCTQNEGNWGPYQPVHGNVHEKVSYSDSKPYSDADQFLNYSHLGPYHNYYPVPCFNYGYPWPFPSYNFQGPCFYQGYQKPAYQHFSEHQHFLGLQNSKVNNAPRDIINPLPHHN